MAQSNTSNLKFVGRDAIDEKSGKLLARATPVETIQNAGVEIVLPAAHLQIATPIFYHKDAKKIAALYPKLYKIVKEKGK